MYCSILAEDVIKIAILNYQAKNPNVKATDLGAIKSAIPMAAL